MSWEEFQKAVSMLDNKIASASNLLSVLVRKEEDGFFLRVQAIKILWFFRKENTGESSFLTFVEQDLLFENALTFKRLLSPFLNLSFDRKPLVIGVFFCKHTWKWFANHDAK